MAAHEFNNPPTSDDWTRTRKNLEHIDSVVDEDKPRDVPKPGGGSRPNISLLLSQAQDRLNLDADQIRSNLQKTSEKVIEDTLSLKSSTNSYRDEVIAGLQVSGEIAPFATRAEAEAEAALGSITQTAVHIFKDEAYSGLRTLSTVENGALVFQVLLPSVANIPFVSDLSRAPRVENHVFRVMQYGPGIKNGGGEFIYSPNTPRSSADNVVSFDPTETGDGSGCFVRVNFTTVTPAMGGAVGDGTTNDNDALQRVFATGLPIDLGGVGFNYLISSTLTMLTNQRVVGNGASLRTTTNAAILSPGNKSVIDSIVFVGSGKSGASDQHGVSVDGRSRYKISNCHAINLGGAAYRVAKIVGDRQGASVSGVSADQCRIGMLVDTRGEYHQISNLSMTNCDVGIEVRGGNTIVSNSVFSNNKTGAQVPPGDNDAHGHFVGCLLNHNSEFSISIGPINVKDFSFHACKIYGGGNIYLQGCKGVRFYDCTIDGVIIYEEGSTACRFDSCKMARGVSNRPNYNAKPSQVFYTDCEWDDVSAVSALSSPRVNGAYSRVELESNVTIPANATTPINLTKKVQNAIAWNVNYSLHTLWDKTAGCWDFNILATPKADFLADVNLRLVIGTGDAPFSTSGVFVKIFDIDKPGVAGTFGYFQAGEVYTAGGANICVYTFSGRIPKGRIGVAVINKTSTDCTLFQGGNAPSFGIAQGW